MTTDTPLSTLKHVAWKSLHEYKFRAEFLPGLLADVDAMAEPDFEKSGARDLSDWLWTSIDNDESRDLDQIEFLERHGDSARIFVAIADVSAFVAAGSAVDRHARFNAASIYTGVQVYPMLPDRLSTDLTSLNENKKRLAIVVEMDVESNGVVTASTVYPAVVKNHAQLTYNAVHTWLSGGEGISEVTKRNLQRIHKSKEIQQQLRDQDLFARAMMSRRFETGALDFDTGKLEAKVGSKGTIELESHEPTRATHLIEEFMVAANEAADDFLAQKGYPCFQRVVRVPKNWPRMVEVAFAEGGSLPAEPDGQALQTFLATMRQKKPERYADISFAMVKLLGRGEYVVKAPGEDPLGHFGLAALNYSHSTAPNRRYPDLITQRLLHAAFAGTPPPYEIAALREIAAHCTSREEAANKVERHVQKCAVVAALTPRIGEEFEGVITGASTVGVWVKVTNPPVEGKVTGAEPEKDVQVGDVVMVELTRTHPDRGFLDFRYVKLIRGPISF